MPAFIINNEECFFLLARGYELIDVLNNLTSNLSVFYYFIHDFISSVISLKIMIFKE